MHTTPPSLLERLRHPGDAEAWNRLVVLYSPLLFSWARKKWGLSEQDAADLVQDIYVVLVEELPQFIYDPGKRFRGWLWTVSYRKMCEKYRKQVQPSTEGRLLPELVVPDAAQEVEDTEYRQYLVKRAMDLMKADFEPKSWQACLEHVVLGKPAKEVAQILAISEVAVYKACSRVLGRLRQELTGLFD